MHGHDNARIKNVPTGLYCEILERPIICRYGDCSHYVPDKPRVRQHRVRLSGDPKSKTGIVFCISISSCSNCVHSVNVKAFHPSSTI